MMKVKRGRMEGWFPLGTTSTCLKTWWRTCTLTRRRASCGCGGFIRNVKEASWGTTWGRWTKSIWIKCVKKLGWCYVLFKEKEHYLLNLAVQCSDGWLFISSEKFKTTSTICKCTIHEYVILVTPGISWKRIFHGNLWKWILVLKVDSFCLLDVCQLFDSDLLFQLGKDDSGDLLPVRVVWHGESSLGANCNASVRHRELGKRVREMASLSNKYW